ncbi:MAG: ABC transporter permease [Flavobacteriaceae bacterium]
MLRYLLEKEFKQFTRNKFLPRFVVIMPLMATLLFPLIANFDVKNVRLVIINHDQGQASHQLIDKINSSGYFKLEHFADTDHEGIFYIESENDDIVLEIPQDFTKDIYGKKNISVMLAVNAVNGTRGALGSQYLANILNEFNSNIRLYGGQKPPIDLVPGFWYNPTLAYPIYMIPALMIMVLSLICGFLPALNIVGEKQNGTMEQMNVTPVKKGTFILSKLIPYWIIGFVVLTVSMIVAWLAYGLVPIGSIGLIYVFASVFILSYSGFGLVISNYATTVQQAMFMMFFFVMTFVFMSGLYTPVENMPQWAQYLSDISPLKYIMRAIRAIYLKESSFYDLKNEFLALCAMAAFFNIWAILSYQKKV